MPRPLQVTPAQARKLAGKGYKAKKKPAERMDDHLFAKVYEFRKESASRRADKRPCWHPVVFAAGRVFCSLGEDDCSGGGR